MVKQGRTIREAINAGNYFGIAGYEPPACESIDEVLQCARERFKADIGKSFEAYRIIGGSIGGYITESIGQFTL